MKHKLLLLLLPVLCLHYATTAQVLVTICGDGDPGFSPDGTIAVNAQTYFPLGAIKGYGGNIYFSEHESARVRCITPAGVLKTIAGNGATGYTGDGGPAINATLDHPTQAITDAAGNVYFIDQNATVIRKVNTAGIITTIAGSQGAGYSGDGGPLALAKFNDIADIMFDNAGNLYIVCYYDVVIRKVNMATGIITRIAGLPMDRGFSGDGGPATAARFKGPLSIAIDNAGNLYVTDLDDSRVRKISNTGIITSIAGTGALTSAGDGGPATAASFDFLYDVAVDNAGNVYVTDYGTRVVRQITPAGIINRYAGTGVGGYNGEYLPPLTAQITGPNISIDADGIMYITDNDVHRIRKIFCPPISYIDQPNADTTVCNGTDASFFVGTREADEVQWQVNTGTGWSNLTDNATYSGTHTIFLQITAATIGMNNYQYRCWAWNNCAELYSNIATLHVNAPLTPAVSITASATTICKGGSVTFTANGSNGGPSPLYGWKINGFLTGYYGTTFTSSYLTNGDVVSCMLISSAYCTTASFAESSGIPITVNTVSAPTLSIAASATSICTGTTVTFTATGGNVGTAPVYQWKKNGVNVGTNSAVYADNGLANGDRVTCTLTCGYACGTGSVTANTIQVFVGSPINPPPPAIFIRYDCNGDLFSAIIGSAPIRFYADVTNGGTAPVYQWKKNGVNVGGNTPFLDAFVDFSDVITCVLTSNSPCAPPGTATSNALEINDFTVPHYIPAVTVTAAGNICTQTSTVFTANTSNAGPVPTYQWQKNGRNVGTNSNAYTDNALSEGDIISCLVTADNASNFACLTQTTGSGGTNISCPTCTTDGPVINTINNTLNNPGGIVVEPNGNIYVAELEGDKIRMITPAGVVTTVAGGVMDAYSGDSGPATAAGLDHPNNLTLDNAGNIYFIDQSNTAIRRIDAATGIITTVMTGSGFADLVFDQAGNLYIANMGGTIDKRNMTTGVVTTVAGNPFGAIGDGIPATSARLNRPMGIAIDKAGNLYIADGGNFQVRKVNTAGIITTIAGTGALGFGGDGGPAIAANFYSPWEIAVDDAGNVYIPDGQNGVRKITPEGFILRYAGVSSGGGYSGDGGPALLAEVTAFHIAIGPDGNIYITDFAGPIRKISCGLVTFYQQPSDTTICNATGDVTFAVKACNAPKFQWQVNTGTGWNDISDNALYSGAGTNTLHITGANTGMNNYRYRCRARNNCNNVFSDEAHLIIKSPGPGTLAIASTQTQICQGVNVEFTATSSDTGSVFTYQWKKNGANVGTNSPTYADNGLANGDAVTCVLTTNTICVTNNPIPGNTITMGVDPVLAPTITITPSANNICAGTPVTFTPTITFGGPAPFYQWQKNGTDAGTGATYTDNTLANGDVIRCILIPNYPCATAAIVYSNTVTMTLTAAVAPTIAITASNNTICAGSPVTFSSIIANGGSAPVHQWKKNGVNVGANNNTYTDNTLVQGDIITCVLTSNAACVTTPTATSNSVAMTVNPVLTPSVTINGNTGICTGETASFTATATNAGTAPVYQWKKNGVNVGTNSTIYTDNNSITGDVITCQLTSNAACLVTSAATSNQLTMTLHVNPVVSLDQTSTICAGSTRLLDAGSFAGYLWSDGSTNRTLSVNTTGTYAVTVTDDNGCKGNGSATISTLLPQPDGFLPPDTSFCNNASLILTPSGAYNSYAWSTGASTASITIKQAGSYSLEVTDANNCKGTNTIAVTTRQCLKGIFVPNAFTPGTDGKNDTFKPILLGVVKQYQLQIFNRWGNLVFQSANYTQGWDGSFKGRLGGNETYVWVCKYQLDGEPVKIERGTVTLIRK